MGGDDVLNQKIKKHLSTIVAATMMSGVVATKKVDAAQNTNNDTDDKSIANKKSLATKTGKDVDGSKCKKWS